MFVYMQLFRHLFLLRLISPQDIFLMHDKDKTQRLEYQEVMPSLTAAGSIHNTFSLFPSVGKNPTSRGSQTPFSLNVWS